MFACYRVKVLVRQRQCTAEDVTNISFSVFVAHDYSSAAVRIIVYTATHFTYVRCCSARDAIHGAQQASSGMPILERAYTYTFK